MRHKQRARRFGRPTNQRQAMFRSMCISLIEHETIRTTIIKAKELRREIEPLVTLSKNDSVSNRRLAFNRIRNKVAVGKLFSELGPFYKTRNGGYVRVVRCGFRHGDRAEMAIVQLVARSS